MKTQSSKMLITIKINKSMKLLKLFLSDPDITNWYVFDMVIDWNGKLKSGEPIMKGRETRASNSCTIKASWRTIHQAGIPFTSIPQIFSWYQPDLIVLHSSNIFLLNEYVLFIIYRFILFTGKFLFIFMISSCKMYKFYK